MAAELGQSREASRPVSTARRQCAAVSPSNLRLVDVFLILQSTFNNNI